VVSHSGNFAHNIGQRIILNHANVYNEALRGGIHGYILLTIEIYVYIHNCALDRFVLPRAINNHERIILSKIRDSLIRFEITVSVIVFTETCVRIVENRPSIFIEIQIHVIVRITFFRVQINLQSSDKSSRCLICNGRIVFSDMMFFRPCKANITYRDFSS